jgi:hypothetical protein
VGVTKAGPTAGARRTVQCVYSPRTAGIPRRGSVAEPCPGAVASRTPGQVPGTRRGARHPPRCQTPRRVPAAVPDTPGATAIALPVRAGARHRRRRCQTPSLQVRERRLRRCLAPRRGTWHRGGGATAAGVPGTAAGVPGTAAGVPGTAAGVPLRRGCLAPRRGCLAPRRGCLAPRRGRQPLLSVASFGRRSATAMIWRDWLPKKRPRVTMEPETSSTRKPAAWRSLPSSWSA